MTEEQHFPGTKSLGHFEKKELDRTASQEATLEIFRWFIVNGEDLPLEKAYRDDWVREIWEEESDVEADEVNDCESQGPVDRNDDRFETWLDTVG